MQLRSAADNPPCPLMEPLVTEESAPAVLKGQRCGKDDLKWLPMPHHEDGVAPEPLRISAEHDQPLVRPSSSTPVMY